MRAIGSLFGIDLIVSDQIRPEAPSHKEDARRIVRHGMKDVLKWLGQDPGPKPGETTTAMYVTSGGLFSNPALVISVELHRELHRHVLMASDWQTPSPDARRELLEPLLAAKKQFQYGYYAYSVPVVMPASTVKVTGL